MKKLFDFLRQVKMEILFCCNSYLIPAIPLWPLRKFLYCLQGLKIGKGSRILMKTRIVCPSGIEIGEYSFVNECCFLDGRNKIIIGNNVTVAIYSKLITGSHEIDDNSFAYKGDSITIGNNVAIFAGCIVLGGANIKDGCIFSAGSVIRSGLYEELGIFAGNPATYIRDRKSNLNYAQDFWKPIFR